MKKWDSKFHNAKTAAMLGDRRYRYVPFHELPRSEQSHARRAYPYKNVGAKYAFVDEHYYYPVKKDGTLASGQRVLAIPYKLLTNDKYMASLGYEVSEGWKGAGKVAHELLCLAKALVARTSFEDWADFNDLPLRTPEQVADAVKQFGFDWVSGEGDADDVDLKSVMELVDDEVWELMRYEVSEILLRKLRRLR